MSTKINQLIRIWPKDAIATSSWLQSKGIARDLLAYYRKSGWVQRVGHSAVIRNGDTIGWPGGVYALQEQLHLPIHPGGKTALSMQGYGHYIPLGQERVILFSQQNVKVPSWFFNCYQKSKLLIFRTNLFPATCMVGLKKIDMGNFEITVSSPERAIMEVLYCLPRHESPDEIKYLMDGLAGLRPETVQHLLECCSSVKVKRTFMVLAEAERHGWLQRLDLSRITFGTGKRALIRGGILHPRYHITIPRTWKEETM